MLMSSDKFKELNVRQARAMISLLQNPLDRSKTARHAVQTIKLSLLPNETQRTTLNLFADLGYITIPDRDLEHLDGSIYLILKAFQAKPDITHEELADVTYLSKPRAVIKNFYRRVGFTPTKTRYTRLEFYDYMGWLDRDAMQADARELDPKATPQLFPATVTEDRLKILYQLYLNPLGSISDIAAAAHCNRALYRYALNNCQGHTSRAVWFNSLGYINIPRLGRLKTSHTRLYKIISDWKQYPGATYKEIADRTGLTPATVLEYRKQLYTHFGYKASDYNSMAYPQLGFYWYMGWFDLPRLQDDAQKAYKELGL